jgi:guanylate kinase
MLVILTGKSGCGKDTLQEELIRKENFKKLISTTTRPKREGEIEGREYYFVDKDKFFQLDKEGFFIEHRSYKTLVNNKKDTWYYGLGKQLSKEDINSDMYITILDLDGAKAAIDYYGKDNCIIAYISLDDKIRESRASKRGGFDKSEWDRRLEDDKKVFSEENKRGLVDFEISNEGAICTLRQKFMVNLDMFMFNKEYNQFKVSENDYEL